MTFEITDKAADWCVAAHSAIGQVRKYTGLPYWLHPYEVVQLLPVDASDEMIAAAYLHDVVEDTAITIEQITTEFGGKIGQLVNWLTDVSKPEDGNRAERKAIDRTHLSWAPAEAQTIKLADLIDNSRCIIRHDPKFAATYMAEKRLLLDVLTEGDAGLHAQATDIVEGYFA